MRQNTTYSGRKLFKSFFRRWNFCGLHSENTGLEFPPTWVYVDRVQKFTLGLIKTGLPSQKFHLEVLFHRWNTLVVVWFKTHITILSLVSPPDRQTDTDRQIDRHRQTDRQTDRHHWNEWLDPLNLSHMADIWLFSRIPRCIIRSGFS